MMRCATIPAYCVRALTIHPSSACQPQLSTRKQRSHRIPRPDHSRKPWMDNLNKEVTKVKCQDMGHVAEGCGRIQWPTLNKLHVAWSWHHMSGIAIPDSNCEVSTRYKEAFKAETIVSCRRESPPPSTLVMRVSEYLKTVDILCYH